MTIEEKNLIHDFKRIAKQKWIQSDYSSNGGVGFTFEKELNKKPDDSIFSDYYGIEIKCKTHFSQYPITLFSVAFDGPTYPEINRIVEKYGSYDDDFTDMKVLFSKPSFKKYFRINNYYFKMSINEKEDKMFLEVYDLNYNLIEKESFVYFRFNKNPY